MVQRILRDKFDSPKRLGLWLGTGLVIALSFGSLATPSHAQAEPTEVEQLQAALDRSVCFNQWDQAIDITGALIANPTISSNYRNQLLGFRQELERLNTNQIVIANNSSCDRITPSTLAVAPLSETVDENTPLDWDAGIATAAQRNRQIIRLDTRPEAEVNPAIPPELLEGSPLSLRNAEAIDTIDGFNVVAGQVGQRYQAYSFLAALGDQVTLDLDVTQILPGTLYTNDDSQLFLFSRSGHLLAQNDDADGKQSLINNFVIPQTDVYFVVVTSHNNDPVLDSSLQTVIGWDNNGGARFDYTLTLTGLTPSTALLR